MIFDFVLEGEEDSLSTCFSDIIVRLKMRKISPYSFLKQFVYSNSPSFNKILRILYKKRILDNDFYLNLIDLFFKKVDLLECSYLLRNIPKQIEEDLFYNLLRHTTGILFSVQDSETLSEALKVYCNVLKIRVKVNRMVDGGKEGGSKDGNNDGNNDPNINNPNPNNPNINSNINLNIISLIIKNLAKMVFFDYQTIQISIQTLYSLSKNPEESVSQLLSTLSLKNVNSLKLIYSVGCIGIIHLEYLEKLENLAKKKKTKMDTIIPEDIKERRKSINASRLSININNSNINNSVFNSSFIEGSSFINNSNSNLLLSINKRKKTNNDNPDINPNNIFDNQDISDFFFFIKEKDLLYNKDALLYGYSKDIPKFCKNGNDLIQEVSYLSLFKLMCLSSEYFLEHKDLLKSSFKHPNPKIRANSVIAMGDFLLYYNSITEDLSQLLFLNLNDQNLIVKKNTLLIIYILLKKNILRITGNSIYLSKLIFDENEEIRNIIKTIIRSLDDNFITIMFYEKMTYKRDGSKEGNVEGSKGEGEESKGEYDVINNGKDDNNYDTNGNHPLKTFIDLFIPLLKDKTKEFIYLKLLRANLDKEIMNYILNKFNFNEKFLTEINMM